MSKLTTHFQKQWITKYEKSHFITFFRIAALIYSKNDIYFCGGTLISNQKVVTGKKIHLSF